MIDAKQNQEPEYARSRVLGAVSEGLIGWVIQAIKIPLIWGGRIIIEVGGALVSATGGRSVERPTVTPQAVTIRGALIALFGFSAWQYSSVAVAALPALGLATPGLAWLAFLAGGGMSAMTQLFQARLLRGDTPSARWQAYAEALHGRAEESEQTIDLTQARARQYNRAGMLSSQVMGVFALGGWALEAWMMAQGTFLPWVSPAFAIANLIPLAIAIALTLGFEVLAQLDEESRQSFRKLF